MASHPHVQYAPERASDQPPIGYPWHQQQPYSISVEEIKAHGQPVQNEGEILRVHPMDSSSRQPQPSALTGAAAGGGNNIWANRSSFMYKHPVHDDSSGSVLREDFTRARGQQALSGLDDYLAPDPGFHGETPRGGQVAVTWHTKAAPPILSSGGGPPPGGKWLGSGDQNESLRFPPQQSREAGLVIQEGDLMPNIFGHRLGPGIGVQGQFANGQEQLLPGAVMTSAASAVDVVTRKYLVQPPEGGLSITHTSGFQGVSPLHGTLYDIVSHSQPLQGFLTSQASSHYLSPMYTHVTPGIGVPESQRGSFARGIENQRQIYTVDSLASGQLESRLGFAERQVGTTVRYINTPGNRNVVDSVNLDRGPVSSLFQDYSPSRDSSPPPQSFRSVSYVTPPLGYTHVYQRGEMREPGRQGESGVRGIYGREGRREDSRWGTDRYRDGGRFPLHLKKFNAKFSKPVVKKKCEICDLVLPEIDFKAHLAGKKHKMELERRQEKNREKREEKKRKIREADAERESEESEGGAKRRNVGEGDGGEGEKEGRDGDEGEMRHMLGEGEEEKGKRGGKGGEEGEEDGEDYGAKEGEEVRAVKVVMSKVESAKLYKERIERKLKSMEGVFWPRGRRPPVASMGPPFIPGICTVCCVFCQSKGVLIDHLKGRRHLEALEDAEGLGLSIAIEEVKQGIDEEEEGLEVGDSGGLNGTERMGREDESSFWERLRQMRTRKMGQDGSGRAAEKGKGVVKIDPPYASLGPPFVPGNCQVCGAVCMTEMNMRFHLAGKRHLLALEGRMVTIPKTHG